MPTASATAMGKVKALRHLVSTMTVSNGMGAIRDKACHDVSMLDAYDVDPLVYKKITVGLVAVIGDANAEALTRAGEIRVPCCLTNDDQSSLRTIGQFAFYRHYQDMNELPVSFMHHSLGCSHLLNNGVLPTMIISCSRANFSLLSKSANFR